MKKSTALLNQALVKLDLTTVTDDMQKRIVAATVKEHLSDLRTQGYRV